MERAVDSDGTELFLSEIFASVEDVVTDLDTSDVDEIGVIVSAGIFTLVERIGEVELIWGESVVLVVVSVKSAAFLEVELSVAEDVVVERELFVLISVSAVLRASQVKPFPTNPLLHEQV